MVTCKLEQIGDRLALVLDSDDVQALDLHAGDTVRLELAGRGVVQVIETASWEEDPHARGRAFLKRYRRTFTQLG